MPDVVHDFVAPAAPVNNPNASRPAPGPRWIDWYEHARATAASRVALVVGLALVAGVAGWIWYRAGARAAALRTTAAARTSATATARSPKASSRSSTTVGLATAGTAKSVTVHVSGAVVHRGLFELAQGARVADAIAAAGGATPDADTDRINLAARVADGQHIIVPRVGEPTVGSADGSTDPSGPAGPISINSAPPSELEKLPHIGPALARAIVDYRQQHGGFRSVHDLRNVRGIGERVYADLVNLVTL